MTRVTLPRCHRVTAVRLRYRLNLALTVVLITASRSHWLRAGALMARRLARPYAGRGPVLLAIALPVVAMVAVALGYPMIVPERAKADAPTVTLAASAYGRLTIEPTEFRAGSAIWEIESTFHRRLTLVNN